MSYSLYYRLISYLLTFSLVVLVTKSAVYAKPTDDAIDYQAARTIMRAIGKIQFQAHQLDGMLSYCGTTFSHLAESAGNAGVSWHRDNNPIIKHANEMQAVVLTSVKLTNSPFAAEKLALEVDRMAADRADEFQDQFQHQSRKQQHYLCNRFILSVSSGERNLATEVPEETRLIMNYK